MNVDFLVFPGRKWWLQVIGVWLLCAIPAIGFALVLDALGLTGTPEANAVLQSRISGSPRAILAATVVGPFLETGILALVVAGVSLVLRKPLRVAMVVGVAAGITHGLVNDLPAQFIGPAWTFFMMALAYQVWRTGGRTVRAFGMVWLVHCLQNTFAVSLVFLDA